MFYGVLCQPNRNEARSAAVGRSAKILGTISGFPDLTVISSDGRTAYMEVKTPKAKPRNAKDVLHWKRQAETQEMLRRMGHKAEIVRSQDEAVALLQEWGWIKP
ncbi:MAG: VRR-NUC domain-containing protein, partial [bacterium]